MMIDTITSIKNKEALRAYQVINSNSKTELNEVVEKLNAFQKYLAHLCSEICKKGLKKAFVYQWIFTNEVKRKDYNSYCKANLVAASECLTRIISKLEKEGTNEVKTRMLCDFICDLKSFVAGFDAKQDYTWLVMNTNSHITNFYHNLSENIFWNGIPGTHPEERLVLATSAPFIIRQSIEYKIKRILGIDYIHLNGKPQHTKANVYFKAIRENKKYYQFGDLDFEVIEKIHSWASYYVHGGYRVEPWRTETALNYLKKLFYSGETSQVNTYSLYAAVELNKADLENVKRNTEKSIKSGVKDNLDIKWLSKPEVAIIARAE